MSNKNLDVTAEYREAENAVLKYNPGQQVDIAALMRAAYVRGYAQALIDRRHCTEPTPDAEFVACKLCGESLLDHAPF